MDQDAYTVALGLASARMADQLTKREKDEKREQRKRNVLREKLQLLRASFPEYEAELTGRVSLKKLLRQQELDDELARTLLVDLSFADPFAPYELDSNNDDVRAVLETIAGDVGVEAGFITEVSKVRREAARAHRWRLTGRHVGFGLLGAGIFAAGGWMLAPMLAGGLGAAAGLSGVAATNFGLALLGGGSLAAGGAGMAGGMALVTGLGAGVGFAGATGASVMHSLGEAGAKAKLVKLQTTYKAVLLRSQRDRAKARRVVEQLAKQLVVLEKDLRRERELNDENSERLKNLEKTIEHVEKSLKWMREQAA